LPEKRGVLRIRAEIALSQKRASFEKWWAFKGAANYGTRQLSRYARKLTPQDGLAPDGSVTRHDAEIFEFFPVKTRAPRSIGYLEVLRSPSDLLSFSIDLKKFEIWALDRR
jgi:hypothetical protein